METDARSTSDEVLAAQASGGDASAFEALFRRHYDMIFAMAYRLCGHQQDAEDVAQEAFVRAARSIKRFRGHSGLKSWLYRIALNATYDIRHRAQKHRRALTRYSDATRHDVPSTDSRVEAADTSGRVLTALAALKYKDREAIVLTVYEGLTHAEAARLTGCAESTISWRVSMARQALKQVLSKELSDE